MDRFENGSRAGGVRRFVIHERPDESGRVRLTGGEAHHAGNVLRLKCGDAVILVDGCGMEYIAVIKRMDGLSIELDVQSQVERRVEPNVELVLGLAMLKSELMELVLQKGTELGLSGFVPVYTERSTVVIPPEKIQKRLERYKKISLEAVKQCRRLRPPKIGPVMTLEEFFKTYRDADLKMMLHPPDSGKGGVIRRALTDFGRPDSICVLVGPAGGFSEIEAENAAMAGFNLFGLGPRILRAETAAIAIMAVLGCTFGDLVDFS